MGGSADFILLIGKANFFRGKLYLQLIQKTSFGMGFAELRSKGDCVKLLSGDFSAEP